MTVYLQYKGGAYWKVKKQSHISISKAPGALIRKNTVFNFFTAMWPMPTVSNRRLNNKINLVVGRLACRENQTVKIRGRAA